MSVTMRAKTSLLLAACAVLFAAQCQCQTFPSQET
jgi:hypothetical protein